MNAKRILMWVVIVVVGLPLLILLFEQINNVLPAAY